ncbi:MAG: YceI family protein [Sideroxyarcus sp.]|nr:YceI family protein [Sideroxyarcus sp.]
MHTRTLSTVRTAPRPAGRSALTVLMQSALLLGLLLIVGHVSALEFNQVQTNESTVTFGYRQMGVTLDGKFDKFTARVAFDPAKPTLARANIDIDVTSIDAGSADANEEVVKKLWFNAAVFPVASFASAGIKALGGNRYEASGKLSIKGRTRDVTMPVTFRTVGTRGIFEGSFAIKRLDYGIGEGIWADVGTVEDEIKIMFHVVVNASPSKK